MTALLPLIDKLDSFEVVRDQIGAILLTEITEQQVLAAAAAKDPNDWKLRIFSERANPWEQFLQAPVADTSPLVNVWYDNSNFDPKASNTFERQKATGVFNIDCYGYAISADDGGSGHIPGDEAAALEVQKALRLVRNILMAAEYTYLGLRGLVWRRWPQSVTVFQPQLDGQAVQNIVGARLALQVEFNEFAPQVTGENMDFVAIEVFRAETGELYFEADYDNTA